MFRSDGAHVMLEGKEYNSIDMVFPFHCVAVDRDTRFLEDGELLKEKNCILSCGL